MNLLSEYEGTGVYVQFDRIDPTADHYHVYRSAYIDGTYVEITYPSGATQIDFPQNNVIDGDGTIDDYYQVLEHTSGHALLNTHPPTWGEELLLRASVWNELEPWMSVPVYQEDPLFVNDDRSIARVASWGPWCYEPRPELSISVPTSSGARGAFKVIPQTGVTDLITQGTTPNYDELAWHPDYNGKIYFTKLDGVTPVSIDWADRIYVDYNFAGLTTHEVNDAIFLAAGGIVAQQGVSKSDYVMGPRALGNMPRRWDYALVAGATFICIRRLMLMLTQRERRLVFLDPNDPAGTSPFNDLQALLTSYKETYEDLKTKIATEKFPSVSIVSNQEYQLPGSRSRMFRMGWKGE